jgi:hypothetical protein
VLPPLTPEHFIVTDPGDSVAGTETTLPGAWYSDQMLWEIFTIKLERELQ